MTKNKKLISIVLAVVLLVGVAVGLVWILRKNNNPTQYDLAVKAVEKVNERNNAIMDTYNRNEASASALNANSSVLRASIATEDQLDSYFRYLGLAYMVPHVAGFVINTPNTNLYQNTFSLDKTIYALYDNRLTYLSMKKQNDNVLVVMQLDDVDEVINYYAEINYDYENEKLISSVTHIVGGGWIGVININYTTNNFDLAILYNVTETDINNYYNNELTYDNFTLDKAATGLGILFSANITSNVNNIIVTEQTVAKDNSISKAQLNSILNAVQFNQNMKNMINTNNAVLNTAIADGMEYATSRIEFDVTFNMGTGYTYTNLFIDYDTQLKLLNEYVKYVDANAGGLFKDQINRQINFITSRGKYAYTGALSKWGADEGFYLQYAGNNTYEITMAIKNTESNSNAMIGLSFEYSNGAVTSLEVDTDGAFQFLALSDVKAILSVINSEAEIDNEDASEIFAECYDKIYRGDSSAYNLDLINKQVGLFYESGNWRVTMTSPEVEMNTFDTEVSLSIDNYEDSTNIAITVDYNLETDAVTNIKVN